LFLEVVRLFLGFSVWHGRVLLSICLIKRGKWGHYNFSHLCAWQMITNFGSYLIV
jgi:uncharacterized membrane protein YobD (UPF0266 family)